MNGSIWLDAVFFIFPFLFFVFPLLICISFLFSAVVVVVSFHWKLYQQERVVLGPPPYCIPKPLFPLSFRSFRKENEGKWKRWKLVVTRVYRLSESWGKIKRVISYSTGGRIPVGFTWLSRIEWLIVRASANETETISHLFLSPYHFHDLLYTHPRPKWNCTAMKWKFRVRKFHWSLCGGLTTKWNEN